MSDTAAATATTTGAAEPRSGGENIASFSTRHYPDGVNSNFLNGGADELGAKYAGEKGLFTNPETRDIAGNVEEIMAELAALGFDKGSSTAAADGGGLKGKNVADIGAGTGLFLPILNEAVGGEGHVYAVEISDGFLELLVNQKDRDGLDQVIVIKGTVTGANLPTDVKMDLVLLIDVYHHIEYPLTYMQKLRSFMKPGGALVVIDFHRIPEKIWSHPPEWVLEHVRAGQDVFTSEILESGFMLDKEIYLPNLRENYFLVFRA